jgi:hypothetical protein
MEIHHAVEDIYRRNPGAFDDTEHLVAALSDYVDTDGSGTGEIRLIVDAVELGSFQRIRELVKVGASPHAAIAETAAALSRNRATDEARSAWACSVLAFASGLVNDADVRSYRARWELPTVLPEAAATQAPPPYVPSQPATFQPSPPVLTQSPPHTHDPPPFSYGQPTTHVPWTPSQPSTYPSPPAARGGPPKWLFAALAVVVVLGVAGVVGVVLLNGDDTPPVEPTATPEVGACHALTTADLSANSDPQPPVPCDDESATAVTTDVVTLPDDVDRSNTEAVWAAVGPECVRTTLSYLGGHAEAFVRSAYTIAFFVPTPEQAADGADWARCDLTLNAGGETQKLPGSVEDSIDQLPLSDDVAVCAEDQASGGLLTTCNLPHAFRATGSLYRDGEVPTDTELVSAEVQQECEGVITGEFAFAFAPAPEFWDAGASYILCFSWDN